MCPNYFLSYHRTRNLVLLFFKVLLWCVSVYLLLSISSPCTSARLFADFNLANLVLRLGPKTPAQDQADPGAKSK